MAKVKMKRNLLANCWQFEVNAVLTSIASLIAIVALIAHFDGKPAFQWHRVTLNAIISTLATVAHSMIALSIAPSIGQFRWIAFNKRNRELSEFDSIGSASRGPWGGTKFLFRTKSWSVWCYTNASRGSSRITGQSSL